MKKWIFWLGIAISIVLMYFSLRKLNILEAWDVIKSAKVLVDPSWNCSLFPGGLGSCLALALSAEPIKKDQYGKHVS